MLGIDIGHDAIRVVNLRRRGGGFELRGRLEVGYAAGGREDAVGLGRKLAGALDSKGWLREKAVMTVPSRLSFVKRFDESVLTSHSHRGGRGHLSKGDVEALIALAQQSMLIESSQLIFDIWMPGKARSYVAVQEDNGVLLGAVEKRQVDFCRSLAESSEVRLEGLELRGLASINGLLFDWRESSEENIAVAYVEGSRVEVGLLDAVGLASLGTLTLGIAHGDDGDTFCDELGNQLQRMFNTMRLTGGGKRPERVFLACGGVGGELLGQWTARLGSSLGLTVTACEGLSTAEAKSTANADADADADADTDADGDGDGSSRYVSAIGAAIDALGASPTWFNFLHPHGRVTKSKGLLWRPFAIAGLIATIAGVAFWAMLLRESLHNMKDLDQKIAQTLVAGEEMLAVKARWELFGPFLGVAQGGSRVEHLRILGEVSALFPNPDVAYITSFTVVDSATGPGKDISIKGKVSQSDVVPGFIDSLNSSDIFEGAIQEGELTHDEMDRLYPYRFSVTCSLRRKSGGTAQ